MQEMSVTDEEAADDQTEATEEDATGDSGVSEEEAC